MIYLLTQFGFNDFNLNACFINIKTQNTTYIVINILMSIYEICIKLYLYCNLLYFFFTLI